MKIQLNYDRPSQIQTDLLVVILDKETGLFDLGGSPLTAWTGPTSGPHKEKLLEREPARQQFRVSCQPEPSALQQHGTMTDQCPADP